MKEICLSLIFYKNWRENLLCSTLFYSTTFYVGDKGVLLFDAPEGRGKYLLQAIRDVTPLPVTALVYSHYHVDHIGDSPFWNDEAKKEGVNLRIIASKATAEKCNL